MDSENKHSAQPHRTTEVTPEMVEAGVKEYRICEWCNADLASNEVIGEENEVKRIFVAMMRARSVGVSR